MVEQARLLELSLTGDAAYRASYAEIVEGELAAEPLQISSAFAAMKRARREGTSPAIAAVDRDAPLPIWMQRLEPRAIARLARRDSVQAVVRAHMARYLARVPA